MKVNYDRQKLSFTTSMEWPEGPIDEVIEYFQNLKSKYIDEIKALQVEVEFNWYGYEDCEPEISYIRYETDEEMNQRIECEKEAYEKYLKDQERKKQETYQKKLDKKARMEAELERQQKALEKLNRSLE